MDPASGRPDSPGAPEPQPGDGTPRLGEAQLRTLITQQVAAAADLDPADVDPERPVAEYGLSSRDQLALAGYLETLLGQPLPPTLLWEEPTVGAVARKLANGDRLERAVRPAPVWKQDAGQPPDPIAIIGLGFRFPDGAGGACGDPERFWSFLVDGGDGVSEVPAQRWAAFDDGSPAVREALAATTRSAAVLGDVAGFDAEFFGITPGEATAMDPQQRMLLEVSWEALENAGLAPRSLRGSQTGVFAGISTPEYAYLTTADLSRVDAWTATGASTSVAAGRLSYLLDLRGPSLAVDTACSSSLVAVHLAAASLRSGESDLALAAGVNLLLSPVITMTFDAGGGTSPDGRCRAFDAAANGMVRGEGCGVVVLKRLADARRDGDRVLAVITASRVNSDGRSNGLVAPNGTAQRDLLRSAYAAAGTNPAEVDYVEAHGTGTPLGDPVEAHALGEVLGAGRPTARPLLLGSVKTNIGHLEAAAGIAGLIKTVLALARRQIPPTLHFATPSPHIPFGELGLSVVTKPTTWPRNPWPPTAGVSAFGLSGTNAHIVLTADPGTPDPGTPDPGAAGRESTPGDATPPDGQVLPCLLSDASPERVRADAARLGEWLAGQPAAAPGLGQISRTLARRAGRGPSRSVVVARDREELADGLAALAAGRPHPGVISGTELPPGPGVVFVFSGYGSGWPGMARMLEKAEPTFAAALDELEEPIRAAAGLSLIETVRNGTPLPQVEQAQPALFGIQVALARLWASYGIHPAAVIGHSMGEVAAAVVCGALTVPDGAQVIACRSRLLAGLAKGDGEAGEGGAMALIGMPAPEVTELAAGLPDAHIAVISSPVQTVITGDSVQVGELTRRAAAAGAVTRMLAAEGAGHSPQVDPLAAELVGQLAGISPRPAGLWWYSTVVDDPLSPPRCDAAYWAANLRRPVRLADAVAAAAQDGFRAFAEISPHPLLRRALAETLEHAGADPSVITGTLRRDTDDALAFHTELARLATAGIEPAEATLAGTGTPGSTAGTIIDIPPAPWRHERYWAEPAPRPSVQGHPLLGPHIELPSGRRHTWQAAVTSDTLCGLQARPRRPGVFPLSAAAEMVIAATCQALGASPTDLLLRELRLVRLYPLSVETILTTTLDETASGAEGANREPSGAEGANREQGAQQRATVRIHARNAAGRWVLIAAAQVAEDIGQLADDRASQSVTAHRARRFTAAVPAATLSRGQLIPAQILDRCLAAACTGRDEVPMSIGLLRVRGTVADGGSCEVHRTDEGVETATAEVRLYSRVKAHSRANQQDQPLIEVRDVAICRVPDAEIPLPYRDKLLELSWQRQDVPSSAQRDSRRWIVLAAPPGALAADLVAALRAAGDGADIVSSAAGLKRVVERGSPPGDGEAADDRAGPELRSATGVVLLAPRAPLTCAAAGRFVLTATRAAAFLAAASLGTGGGRTHRLWVVTAGAIATRPGEAGEPGLAALRGLIRVLAIEQPSLRATLVDLDPAADKSAMSSALQAELVADQPDDEVAWRDGRRMAARLVRSADAQSGSPRWRSSAGQQGAGQQGGGEQSNGRRHHRGSVVRPGGGYLITGGYGSIGLAVARWLADRGAGRIVLGGRAGPSGDARKLLDELTASGTEVRVVRGDIAQPGVAEQLVTTATAGGMPLCGVVHAAGARADALIADLTAAGLSKAWSPKVTGAWRLHEATEGTELDWFVLCSSAAALLGSPGQAGYAAANAWLDGFAAWRRANGLPATSVNWGLWSEAAQSAGIALAGIDPISAEEGIEALEALLAEEREAVGVIRLDTAKAAAAYPEIAGLPFFGQLLGPQPDQADAGSAEPADDWPGLEAIRNADPPRRSALVRERIRLRAAAVLGVSGDALAPDLPLTDAGLDSLAAVRVANLLARDLGISVDPALLLGGATITGLQKSITSALEGAADGVAPRDAAERQVTRVVAGVLAADSLGVTDDLRLLGLTEAGQVEIAARLTAETGHPFDAAALFASPAPVGSTVAGPRVASMAEMVRHAEEAEAAVMIRELRPGGARPPLILAHPAGGTCGAYTMLAGLLDRDRPVLGLERIEGGVEDRAARYAAAIRDRHPDGGWILGGWSFGGVLGYETARQLAAGGGRPGLVVLLDAALPLPVAPAEEAQLLAHRFAAFAEYLTRTYRRPVPLTAEELLGLEEDAQLAVLTERMTAAGLTAELSPAILRHQQTSHEDTRALERYRADPYHGPVVLYRATGDTPWLVGDPRYEITDEARGWRPLCRQLEVVPVDAHHLNLLDPPAVHAVAAHLRALLTS